MVYRFFTILFKLFSGCLILGSAVDWTAHFYKEKYNIITSIVHNMHNMYSTEAMNVGRADLPLERDHKTTQPAIIIIYHHFSFDWGK